MTFYFIYKTKTWERSITKNKDILNFSLLNYLSYLKIRFIEIKRSLNLWNEATGLRSFFRSITPEKNRRRKGDRAFGLEQTVAGSFQPAKKKMPRIRVA